MAEFSDMDKTKLIVVAGPTASGKTALAVQIAKAVGGSVICADSMQVYKGMSIATAAPAKQEMQGVPHMLNEFLERLGFFFRFGIFVERQKMRFRKSRRQAPCLLSPAERGCL